MNLKARILVADDQRDVATTLTNGLRAAGATVAYVSDGEAAVERVQLGATDLLLLDMKMPPADWGGLWALTKLKDLGLSVPVIVLSGEGGQQQTIEAMRLGARDWVDKGSAARELVERCTDVLEGVRREALANAAQSLPTPIAHDFARYIAAADVDRSVAEGLRAIEGIVRFAALTALATRTPSGGGIAGVQEAQLSRPSLGTWLAVARALTAEADLMSPASVWIRSLLPEKGSINSVQSLVTLRNDIAHAGHQPTVQQAEAVRECLTDVAHRLGGLWGWHLHVVRSLDYDGNEFLVRSDVLAGPARTPGSFGSITPLRTGDVVLVNGSGAIQLLTPWLQTIEVDGQEAIAMYDSAGPRRSDGLDAPLQFADPVSRRRGLTSASSEATWGLVRRQFEK